MISVKKSSAGTKGLKAIAAYVYDIRGLRVESIKTGSADEDGSSATDSGTTTYYQYGLNGELLWTDDGTTQEKYIYARATIWAEVLTTDGESATYYHHTDHTGTTECITDAGGTVVWDASYEAYGKLVHENGTVSFKASFTGKQIDEDTGLYYFNARWYDADLGRFVTEDPARDGTNWYEYCRNNPLKYMDPTGLDDEEINKKNEGSEAIATSTTSTTTDDDDDDEEDTLKVQTSSTTTTTTSSSSSTTTTATDTAPTVTTINESTTPLMGGGMPSDVKNLMDGQKNEHFADIVRLTVGATYSHKRAPTDTKMDCSGTIVYALDKMGYNIDIHLTAEEMASGEVAGIKILPDVNNARQGEPGILNFYKFGDPKISHVNVGVGMRGSETENQIIDASSADTGWEDGRNRQGFRQSPTAEAGKINKTWAPFSTTSTPEIQAIIDWDRLKRKDE